MRFATITVSRLRGAWQYGPRNAVLCTLPLAFVFAACAGSASIRAEDALLRQRFQQEYPVAIIRVQEAYGRARIKAKWSLPPRRGGTTPLVNYVEFAGKGEMLRMIHTPENPDPAETRVYAEKQALVANPKVSFALAPKEQPNGNSPGDWSVAAIEPFAHRQERIRMDFRGLFAPYLVNARSMKDFAAEPGVSVTSFESVSENGKQLVRKWWRIPRPDDQDRVVQGWFLFDPEGSWVLRAYRFGSVGKDFPPLQEAPEAQHAIFTYENSINGIPLLKSAVFKVETPAKSEHENQEERWDILSIEFTEVPAEEFTLTSFGLPDIGEKQSNRVLYWLLAGGVGLIVLSLLLAWWSRKRNS